MTTSRRPTCATPEARAEAAGALGTLFVVFLTGFFTQF